MAKRENAEVSRRRERLKMFWVEGLAPIEITRRLIAEELISSSNFGSAYRLVRKDLQRIRAEVDAQTLAKIPAAKGLYVAQQERLFAEGLSRFVDASENAAVRVAGARLALEASKNVGRVCSVDVDSKMSIQLDGTLTVAHAAMIAVIERQRERERDGGGYPERPELK